MAGPTEEPCIILAEISRSTGVCGVKTLRTQDTSYPRQCGTVPNSAELSGHIGTSAEVSYGQDTSEPGNTVPNRGDSGQLCLHNYVN